MQEYDTETASACQATSGADDGSACGLSQLLERIKAKDQTAMAELYVQCRAKVFRQVACFIHDPPLAHDVTQEVFLRIWRYAASYDPAKSTHAQAWINQAARNQVMTELARRRRRREDPEEAVEDKADEHAEPRQMARVVVQSPVFSAAMNTLAPATRKVILMRYFQDLSLQEIATELQLPLGTVKTWLHRGLARMKVQLDMQRS